jgi:hypothetical protein
MPARHRFFFDERSRAAADWRPTDPLGRQLFLNGLGDVDADLARRAPTR